MDATKQPFPQDLFIAVLRDVPLERAQEVSLALYKAGFRMMSITTNTKDFDIILRHVASQDLPGLTLGASSVCSVQEVRTSSPATSGSKVKVKCHPMLVVHGEISLHTGGGSVVTA